MGAIAIDVNDMVQVNAAGIRALSSALGDDGARAFINQFKYGAARTTAKPRITATQIADIFERARVKAEARRDIGEGDYTAEKKHRPQMTFEESTAMMMEADKQARVRRGMAAV